MRTISIVKASLFTLILAFMVIGTIAIAEVMKKEQPVVQERAVVTDTWYFSPNPTDPDPDPNLATNYSKTRPSGVQCGGDTDVICSIEDEADSEDDSIPQMSHGEVTEDDSDLYAKSYRQ